MNPGPWRSSWKVQLKSTVRRVVPVVAWLAAVALAIAWPMGSRGIGEVAGFAEVDTITLNPIESGVVRRVHVQLHSHVDAGQILLEMDDFADRAQLALLRVEVERLQAEAAAEEVRLKLDQSRLDVQAGDLARRFLSDRENAHVDYLNFLVADLQARAELQGAKVEAELVGQLFSQEYSPFREVNEAQTRMASLQAVVDANVELLRRANQRFEDADRRWFNHLSQMGEPVRFDAVFTPLRLAADEKRLEIDELSRRIESSVLRSPISGQITSLTSHPGDRVLAGTALVGISPTGTRRVVAYLPEGRTLSVEPGDRVAVRRVAAVAGTPKEYLGTVSSVSAVEGEVPVRYRAVSTIPSWGRAVVVTLEPGVQLVPGESSLLRFGPTR